MQSDRHRTGCPRVASPATPAPARRRRRRSGAAEPSEEGRGQPRRALVRGAARAHCGRCGLLVSVAMARADSLFQHL